ncbi:MAG: transglutaminase family protein [Methanoregula sp.]|jgi:transglutaminase-like putative cysteine protease|nr:transglutaminase family protein [Methanoregula sp.]
MDPVTDPADTVSPDPRDFLAPSRIINYNHPAVRRKARELAASPASDEVIAKRCFHFVRDEVRHSADFQLNPVTLTASEVLEHRTGFCYAKSHLLAALLRANGIPAGLCYQRLAFDSICRPFALHGLNAVYLPEQGWYRIDARGNKPGVDARFDPPDEYLAYNPCEPGEGDLPGIFTEPLPEVVDVLKRCLDYGEVLENPPDRPLP